MSLLAAEAVSTTQWLIAIGSLASALIALALAFGLKEWVFRPRIDLLLRHRSVPDEISDRVITKRITTGELAAFVRLRVYNNGRSTARNVALRLLHTDRWDASKSAWRHSRPELDGWLLQPSNQYESHPATVDVFPGSDRIVDLASVALGESEDGSAPLYIEIAYPWPPNEANRLEPGTWQLTLLVCGDNIPARRSFVTIRFDGFSAPAAQSEVIWDHFAVGGPSPLPTAPTDDREASRHSS